MGKEETTQHRKRIPLTLPITALVLLILGLVAAPAITASFSETQLNRNALLSGIGFLTIFIAIILFYIASIQLLAFWLNGRVSFSTFRLIEYILIGGIVAGVFGMFQPWVFLFFRYGFYLLLLATLGFIAWTHVTPAPATLEEEPPGTAVELTTPYE